MPDAVTRLNAALEGRYRIERELGEGGMATVYLAEDLRHERKVALKVLKPELAAVVGAERFLAEIKTTANLQHPHILPLFDSGEADHFLFYVMPHVEGESLRDRLDREHQLPVSEAVQIATEIAEALEAAHEQGVIHRDVKPANILLSKGHPLVADFGIALALGAAGRGRLTETGLSLGTPHYMSPEQATGDLSVGAATDIYSLGCVLYEMLVGDPPYTGSTPQAILGKIISGETTPATAQRASVPAHVDAAIRKAIEKVPADRFRGAQDFAKALADPGFSHGEPAGGIRAARRGQWTPVAKAATGAAVVFALGFAWALSEKSSPAPPSSVVRFTVPTSTFSGPGRPWWTTMALSPSGDLLAYDWDGALYTRRLDRDRGELLDSLAGVPVFSPDGDWMAFTSGSWLGGELALKRLSLTDGSIETLATAPPGLTSGITWGDDGTIVVSSSGALYRVSAAGGEWSRLLEPDSTSRERFYQPHMLPGSETLLAHVAESSDPEQADIVALDLATGTRKVVLPHAMDPRYVPTGHLLFVRQGTLMAVRFDVEELEVRGEPVVLVEDVMHAVYTGRSDFETGAAQVAVSRAGHLAYQLGGVTPERSRVVLGVSPAGSAETLDMPRRGYGRLRLSPDGDRLAMEVRHGPKSEIWVHDLTRGVGQRLNTGGFNNNLGAWSPDGRRLAFSSDGDIVQIAADGSGEPRPVAEAGPGRVVMDWSSQGLILYLEEGDLWTVAPEGEPVRFLDSETVERYATFSPDGRWLAYVSNQSGREEVYVRPFPGPEPALPISGDGGFGPVWSRDGRRLFFLAPADGGPVMMSVDVDPGDTFRAGRATPLIPWPYPTYTPTRIYDVRPDGSFLVPRSVEDPGSGLEAGEVHIVLNWFNELRERVPN